MKSCWAPFCFCVLLTTLSGAQSATTFSRVFAPQDGATASAEKPCRLSMCLNGSWQFQPKALPATFQPNTGAAPDLPAPTTKDWDATPIKIPSPWNVNAFNVGPGGDFRCYPSYPKTWENAQMGWLKKDFNVPSDWKGKHLMLRFDAIAGQAVVMVNGTKVGENFDLFLPAQYDVTDQIKFGASNEILVGVRKASLFNSNGITGPRPYLGGSMWGQSIVGIWQDVSLIALPAVRASDSYVTSQVSQKTLSVEVTLQNDSPTAQVVTVGGQVSPWINEAGKSVLDAPEPKWRLGRTVVDIPGQSVTVPAAGSVTISLSKSVGDALKTWTPDTPILYGMVVCISQGRQILDRKYTRFGWREFTFQGNHQLLNGKPLELRGDSWHFMGIPQMTRRYAWAWFTALKDANCNAVRLHAQPYPSLYLDVADEMGICVLDETAIWDSDAGHKYDSPDFWTRADDQVRRLILRDRNHASVFGWSVSNEVAWRVNPAHPDLMERLKQGWRDWLATERKLDPSRPWVSTDGDNDGAGIMPTLVGHYNDPKNLVRTDKPYGEGETGGSFFATPRYAARFNGSRAYESEQGRIEGLAIEAYEQIKKERESGFSYSCVFNLVWYGLQPLELGQTDTTRPYTMSDGIFFKKYTEGQPGVQPERLGPYCSTLNPGYDPGLPLYRPWSMFDAIKAANTPGVSAPCPWDHHAPPPANAAAAIKPHIAQIVVLADPSSAVPFELTAFGAPVADSKNLDTSDFIVIDGANLPKDISQFKQRIDARVKQGATCFVVGATATTLDALNILLPAPIGLTDRSSTSLIIKSGDPFVSGMDNADFYFTESGLGPVIRHGLNGPMVERGRVILGVCPADWTKWNNVGESIKTASILRSERENNPSEAAMLEMKAGAGRYVITSIDLSHPCVDVLHTVTHMLANAGVEIHPPTTNTDAALDSLVNLTQALVCGRFGGVDDATLYKTDHIGINDNLKPATGSKSGGMNWTKMTVASGGAFDFRRTELLQGPVDNAAVYMSFWVGTPEAQSNAPLPKLDLLMGSDDGCQVWLNSRLVKEDLNIHPVTPDSIIAENLPIKRGWNHFIVKVVQGGGDWGYTARFRCSDARFLLSLRSSIAPPTQ